MTQKYKTIFTSLFLIQFILCAVSPLSAIVSREQSQDVSEKQSVSPGAVFPPRVAPASFVKSPDIKERKGGHIDPFIFDMALWKILKRGKPSDDESGIKLIVKKIGLKNFPETVKCGIISSANVLQPPFHKIASQSPASRVSFRINTPLLYSGLSPPLA